MEQYDEKGVLKTYGFIRRLDSLLLMLMLSVKYPNIHSFYDGVEP
jgi:hypothetical protein